MPDGLRAFWKNAVIGLLEPSGKTYSCHAHILPGVVAIIPTGDRSWIHDVNLEIHLACDSVRSTRTALCNFLKPGVLVLGVDLSHGHLGLTLIPSVEVDSRRLILRRLTTPLVGIIRSSSQEKLQPGGVCLALMDVLKR